MKTLPTLLIAILFVFMASTTDAANLLYEDTFDNLTSVSAGTLGSVATWSSVASPGGKAGNSLELNWPADGTQGWDHLSHNLGNTTIPTSGKVTIQWSFMQSGDPEQQWVEGICRDTTSWYGACIRGTNNQPNKLGLYVMDSGVLDPASGPAYSSDVWNTTAMVFDMDATTDNLEVYFAEGLDTPTTGDHISTQSIDLNAWPIVTFQAIRYGYTSVGAWTNYIDDLQIYEGEAVVPEPSSIAMLLLGGLCACGFCRRR